MQQRVRSGRGRSDERSPRRRAWMTGAEGNPASSASSSPSAASSTVYTSYTYSSSLPPSAAPAASSSSSSSLSASVAGGRQPRDETTLSCTIGASLWRCRSKSMKSVGALIRSPRTGAKPRENAHRSRGACPRRKSRHWRRAPPGASGGSCTRAARAAPPSAMRFPCAHAWKCVNRSSRGAVVAGLSAPFRQVAATAHQVPLLSVLPLPPPPLLSLALGGVHADLHSGHTERGGAQHITRHVSLPSLAAVEARYVERAHSACASHTQ